MTFKELLLTVDFDKLRGIGEQLTHVIVDSNLNMFESLVAIVAFTKSYYKTCATILANQGDVTMEEGTKQIENIINELNVLYEVQKQVENPRNEEETVG